MILKPNRRSFMLAAAGLITLPAIAKAGSISLLGAGKAPSGGSGFPAEVVNRALLLSGPPTVYGYVRSGGIMAGILGVSGGTISGTLVPGFVPDAVITIVDGFGTTGQIVLVGDATAALASVTNLLDNSTPHAVTSVDYDPGISGTSVEVPTLVWNTTGNRTVQFDT